MSTAVTSLPPVVADALEPIQRQRPGARAARRVPGPPAADAAPSPAPAGEADPAAEHPAGEQLPSWLRNKSLAVDAILLEIPVGPVVRQFPNSRVDLHLDRERAKRFHAILVGLIARKAKLANGKPVRTNADVVRWLLDQPDLHAERNPNKSAAE